MLLVPEASGKEDLLFGGQSQIVAPNGRTLTKSRPEGFAASAKGPQVRPGHGNPSEHWYMVNPTMRHT